MLNFYFEPGNMGHWTLNYYYKNIDNEIFGSQVDFQFEKTSTFVLYMEECPRTQRLGL